MGKKKPASKKSKSKKVHTLIPKDEMISDGEPVEVEKQVYLPGMDLEEGMELEPDMSVYVMLRSMQTEWPCLSFDLVRDRSVAVEESVAFPMTGYMVAGSQSSEAGGNQLMLVRCSNLHKNQAEDEGESDEDSDDGDEEEEEGKRPHYAVASLPHPGCVNRVRVHQSHPALLTATWSEEGAVHVWGLQDAYRLVSEPTTTPTSTFQLQMSPVGSIQAGAEGYALDWARHDVSLLAGDCSGGIRLIDQSTVKSRFDNGGSSVEDLQWSPTERTVFASSSCDGFLRLWDTRMPTAALSTRLSPVDLNVISWNRNVGHLVAAGDDAGRFCTVDLRNTAAAAFGSQWHKAAITSIEWNPTDASVLAVSGADDQVTLWDLAIEEGEGEGGIPPQLLFIHQGQRDVKEIHWHPQHSGVLVSTAGSGFNIFKTISV